MPKLRPKEELPAFDINEYEIEKLPKTKGGRMQLKILKAAIHNIGHIGIENTTYESIAKEAGVGKSHVAYYFADKDYIFEAAIKLVNHTGQTITAQNVGEAKTWQDKLIAVVDSSIEWMRKHPEHIPVLLQYFQRCSFRKDTQRQQARVRNIGRTRIEDLLKLAVSEGDLKLETASPGVAEKIQTTISGHILEYTTTKRQSVKEMRHAIFSIVSALIGFDLSVKSED